MRLPIVLGLMAAVTSCGKKSTSDPSTTDLSTEVQTALGLGYPGSLSLSVFPTDTSRTTLRLDDGADDANPESLKAKSAEAANYLNGKAENCLPPVFLRPAKQLIETCYEFDQEMIYGNRSNGNGPGPFYGTPDGKSTVGGSQEACLISFARAQIKEVENVIDQGLGLQQGMICQAVKDRVDVAAASTEAGVDLKTTLGEAMDSSSNSHKPKVTVDEANMSKGSDGVYRVTIKVNMVTKDGKTIYQTYSLNHVPDNADNSTYHGVMSIARSGDAGGPRLRASAGTRYLSVAYTRVEENGAKKLRAELRTARFDSTLAAKALAEDGTVDFNAGTGPDNTYTGFANQNDAVAGMMLVGFDLNTDNDTGTFEYWQNPGANYSEAARGMIFKLEQNPESKRLEGCGMSGAALGTGSNPMDALSIRRAIKTAAAIRPTGSMHPFMNIDNQPPSSCSSTSCTNSNYSAQWNLPLFTLADNITAAADWAKKGSSNFVTRQCVGQNAEGIYVIDPVQIKEPNAGYELFNPTNRTDLAIGRPERPKNAPPPPPAK